MLTSQLAIAALTMTTGNTVSVADFGQGIPELTKLAKLYTPEGYKAAADAVQFAETLEIKGSKAHSAAVDKFVEWLETVDDNIKVIPFAGPLLATLIDIPAVDKLEADFVAWLFNLIPEKIRELIETVFQFIFKI